MSTDEQARVIPLQRTETREPLWRHVVGDVLRRERHAQKRTLKDVSEILAAAARALGLRLADLLTRAHRELAEAELTQTTPRPVTSTRGLSCGGPPADTADARSVTSGGEPSTRYTRASGTSQWTVRLAA